MKIHPTAIVSPEARIASDVEIGPFSVVESGVVIESGCSLASRVTVKSGVYLGENNTVCEGVVLGGKPQHIHLSEECGGVKIGRNNIIRENSTVHCAMYPEKYTLVGDNNFLMVNAHVAHDCVVGNHVILTNNAMLGGHVRVEDRANVSGGVAVHQFCRIGMFAMVGGLSHIVQDVPPFVTVDGGTSLVVGINSIGLRRAGISNDEIRSIREAYRVLYEELRPLSEVVKTLRQRFTTGLASHYAEFLIGSKRGFIQDRRNSGKSLKLVRPEESEKNEIPISTVASSEGTVPIRVTG